MFWSEPVESHYFLVRVSIANGSFSCFCVGEPGLNFVCALVVPVLVEVEFQLATSVYFTVNHELTFYSFTPVYMNH